MEADSEGENQNKVSKNVGNSNEGQSKPKRQMKTPFQLENLEEAYALEAYPSEATRAELSEKLGLSDRQLQMWFCHRRLKDKKETPSKKPRKAAPLQESTGEELRPVGPEPGSDYGSGSGSGSSPFMEPRKVVLDDEPIMRRYYESSPQSVVELRAIACVEAQLGEPLREDGPILGMEFDPLPPDAFGAPIAMAEQQKRVAYPYECKGFELHDSRSNKASARSLHDYQFHQDQTSVRSDAYGQVAQSPYHDLPVDTLKGRAPFVRGDNPMSWAQGVQDQLSNVRLLPQQDKQGRIFSSPHRNGDCAVQLDSLANNRAADSPISHPIIGLENPDVFRDAQILHNDTNLQMEKKRKSDEPRIARDFEACENRIRKDLEKQENLRRKSEERTRKEMERHDRERRKEEERLMRERKREEERLLREQKRELAQRERFLQKECLRVEKMRQKEELRREREEVKRKAAIEKAAARRIAKESLDLIEDKQLELMELAAASKGLQSIVHLDYNTLQSLESFRDSLIAFPPEFVQLKKPFAIQPWMDSEENIGNLLMVWRFFITFADVLGLWPFTLDEFVQAFHDYDSRLLGEIHIALLKIIIRDIEDVARTPSTGLGANQYSAASPEGGHLQIVDGAYMWGFDIRNWKCNLNPLTWPEIFRQLALSAGYGPELKKGSVAWRILGIDDKVKGCEDIISTLRNGSAAENAFTLMREKGLLLPRRSRHRLTPGTVKFAAFHVLSLEGSKGLTVLELAGKIQKSGLRDLTTSKTPEASISVALTRDQKLFERIAPSTYCVRAAYRKDPADAEVILSAARKKIQIFENGFLGGENADDVDRDEDFEGDVDEDPEVDDFVVPFSSNKTTDDSNDVKTCLGRGKDYACSDVSVIVPFVQDESENQFSSFPLNGPKDTKNPTTIEPCVANEDVISGNTEQENIEIDESKSGESWIQGLSEGEYSHLSVEERLNALVTLVGIANEGNSIRTVLEDRLEAANALKKQMWAEAQLDRNRLKDDIISKLDFQSFAGGKAEAQVTSSAVEGNQSPSPLVDSKSNEASPSTAEDQKPPTASENIQNHLDNVSTEKGLVLHDPSTNPNNLTQQHGYASKRSRSQLKAYISHIAEDTYVYRSLPLGQDRRRNRYWQFVTSASRNDPCAGRIFVELCNGNWRLIDSEEAFDGLMSSLDPRGIRESHLRIMFQKLETSFKDNVRRNLHPKKIVHQSITTIENEAAKLDSSPNFSAGIDSPSSMVCGSNLETLDTFSSFGIELGRNDMEKKNALKRYLDFQKWMWKECFNSLTLCAMKNGKKRSMEVLATCELCFDSYLSEDAHCHSCHQTCNTAPENFDFSEHGIQCKEKRKSDPGAAHTCDSSLALGVRLLKGLLAFTEASVPLESLETFWTENRRKTWGMKLNKSSSTEELLQLLIVFESALKQDCLPSNFEMTKELLGFSTSSGSALYDSADLGSVPVPPWMPRTSAAVALQLFDLDASIVYSQHEKAEPCEDKSVKVYMKLPSRYSPVKNKDVELKELKQDEHFREGMFIDPRNRWNSNRGRRGSLDQSARGKRRVPSRKSDTVKRRAKKIENLNQMLRQQGRRTNVRRGGWGPRTGGKRKAEKMVGKRKAEKMVGKGILLDRMTDTVDPKSYDGSTRNLGEEEWVIKKTRMDTEAVNDRYSVEAAESDDNAEAEEYEQGNWGDGFIGASNGWNPMEVSDDDRGASGFGDYNGIKDMVDEDSEGDEEMSNGSDEIANKMVNDEGTDSSVSDEYSE